MEFLVALLLAAVFIGPTVYRLYEKYKHPKRAKAAAQAQGGRSYGRHMLGMLVPVMLLVVFLAALGVGLYFLGR